jgi:hypothetical protein
LYQQRKKPDSVLNLSGSFAFLCSVASVRGWWYRLVGLVFPGYFFIREPLSDDALQRDNESLCVIEIASVEAEGLLIEIAEQVKGLDAHIGSVDASLQETPKVFDVVRVNIAVNVLDRVVDDLVRVVGSQSAIGQQRVTVERGTGLHVFSHGFL